ncbi:MAG: hypothetical protein NXI31_04525 [bacterium]|nr:hypothetical protein [bacterium]
MHSIIEQQPTRRRCWSGAARAARLSWGVALAVGSQGVAIAQRPLVTVGGSNPNFLSLQAAVTAAAPGSVLEVRAGTYTGFVVDKSLRIQFGSGVIINAPSGATHAVTIQNLPPGQDLLFRGSNTRVNGGALGGIRVRNCSGTVMLDEINGTLNSARIGLSAQNVASLFVRASRFGGLHGLEARDAVLVSDDVAWSSAVGVAVTAVRGTLEFTHGSFVGNLAPAIRLVDTAVRLAGDGSTRIEVQGSTTTPIAAFEAINTDVQFLSSRFVMLPKNGANAFSQVGGALFTDDVPGIETSYGPPGSVMRATLTRGTSAPGFLLLGKLTRSHAAFGVQGIYLDELAPLFPIAVGQVNSTGLTRQVTWPNAAWLLGEVFGCQGYVLPATGGGLRSAPGIWAAL